MIIPAVFYGRYTEVKARTEKIVSSVLKGKSFADSLPDRRTVDTSVAASSYLNLLTHRDISIVQSHFHFTLLRSALIDAEGAPDAPAADRLFAELLDKEWGPLVFADMQDGWFASSFISDNAHRLRPYLDSVNRHSRVLDREGARFIGSDGRLGSFWQANSALRFVLEASGVSSEVLARGLTAQSFRALYAGLIG